MAVKLADHLGPLIPICQAFNISIQEGDYAEISDKCMRACKNAYKDGNWGLIESQDGLGLQGENALACLRDRKGRTLLMRLIKVPRFVEHLIKHKVGIHETDALGNTALHIAAAKSDTKVLPLLLNLGYDTKNHAGATPLYIAIKNGRTETLKYFLERNVNINSPLPLPDYPSIEMTPLLYAIMQEEIECADLLMAHLIKQRFLLSDQKANKIGSVLHVAVYFRKQKSLRYLLHSNLLSEHLRKHGSDLKKFLNEKNTNGLTPLNLAASLGETQMVQLLFNKGAYLDEPDFEKKCPIHHAAIARQLEMVQVLAALGCKLDAKGPRSRTAQGLLEIDEAKGDKASDTLSIINFLANAVEGGAKNIVEFKLQLPRYLVFKGGGPKGYAYAGTLQALEEKHAMPGIQGVAGTSAGAITAFLVAIGYNYERLKELLNKTIMVDILFDPPVDPDSLILALEEKDVVSPITTLWRTLKSARKPANILFHPFETIKGLTGICLGEKFRLWVDALIEKETGIKHLTFGELSDLIGTKSYKHLTVFASQIGVPPSIVRFSSDDSKCRNYIISDAIRSSMSIPEVFVPHQVWIKEGGKEGERVLYAQKGSFVDGGLLYNLPIQAFDEQRYISRDDLGQEGSFPVFNTHTLGFDLCQLGAEKAKPKDVTTVYELLTGAGLLFWNAEELLRQMNTYNASRIVPIDTGDVGLLSFDLSEKQRKTLIDSGYQATINYFDKKTPILAGRYTTTILTSTLNGKISLPPTIPDKEFAGRQKQLTNLAQLMCLNNWHPMTEAPIALIFNKDPLGKTELALKFAHQNMDKFSLIKFIPCKQSVPYYRAYRQLAEVLSINVQNMADQKVVDKVNQALESITFKEGEEALPWLLIFDDVQGEISLPKRGGSILLTSSKTLDSLSPQMVSIMPLEANEIHQLFPKNPEENVLLIESLGGSPLLLNLVKCGIRHTNLSVLEYLKQLPSLTDKAVFQFTLELLNTSEKKAADFLKKIAYLSPESIDATLEEIAYPQDDVLTPLKEFGIIRYDKHAGTFSCRPEFQELTIASNASSFETTLALLDPYAKLFDPEKQETWKYGDFLFQQVNYLILQDLWDFTEVSTPGFCLNQAGRWLTCCQNDAKKALPLHRQALPLLERLNLGCGETRKEIGFCYSLMGQHEEALESYERAFASPINSEKWLAHLWILKGKSLSAIGNFEEAGRSYQAARDAYPANDINTALCLTYIADNAVLQTKAYTQEILLQYQEALAAWIKATSEEDPHVVDYHFKIGKAYIGCNNPKKAKESFEKALAVQEKLKNSSQPDIAKIHYQIGLVQEGLKEYEKAIESFAEALKTESEPVMRAQNHSSIGSCNSKMSNHLRAINAYKEAVFILLDLPDNKIQLSTAVGCLADALNSLGNISKTEEIRKELLKQCQEKLKPEDKNLDKFSSCGQKEGCIVS